MNSAITITIMKNKYLFTLILAMLTSSLFAQNNEDFAGMWENSKQYTLGVVKAMPDNLLDYKPDGKFRTFREEAEHIINNLHFLTFNYLTEKGGAPKYDASRKSKEEILEKLAASFDMVTAVFEQFVADDLKKEVKFFTGDLFKKQRILYLLKDHTTHHRAKMIIYLRLNDIAPPSYVGW